MPRTRGRIGRIQQLPPAIKTYIDDALRDGAPQKDILARLATLCESAGIPPISRSALNRHATRLGSPATQAASAGEALATIAEHLKAIERSLRRIADQLSSD